MMSTTVGPAGSTRFSTRRCGVPSTMSYTGRFQRQTVPLCSRSSAASGRPPRGEDLDRVLLVDDRQQRGEVARVLLEQVEDAGDPPLAEPHPRPYALRLELRLPGVGGLGEQRDPRLAPELAAEQVRRVRPERDLHPGQALRGVPVCANASGLTCRCSCRLVQAASGAIESAQVSSASAPRILMCRSSPRASSICSSSSAYRGLALIERVGSGAPRSGSAGCRS